MSYTLIRPGCFTSKEKPDLIQDITTCILEKLPLIAKQFRGLAKDTTFLTVVIRNICYQKLRESKRCPDLVNVPNETLGLLTRENSQDTFNLLNPEIQHIVYEATVKLERIFQTLPLTGNKIYLFLLIYYGLPVHKKDIVAYSENGNTEIILELINKLKSAKETKSNVYQSLTKITHICEGRSLSPDAMRWFLNKQIEEILVLLNGNPKCYDFDKDSFRVFFEYFSIVYCKK